MTRFRRRLGAAVMLGLALGSCAWETDTGAPRAAGTRSPAFTSTPPAPQPTLALPKCGKLPKKLPFPKWVPDDLPLPKPIYAYQETPEQGGFKGMFFLLKGTTTVEFTKLVLEEWPKAGYTLGRGDAEPGEVEDDFHKPPAVGAFKANDIFCRPRHMIMYLLWAKDGPTDEFVFPTPTSTGTPLKS